MPSIFEGVLDALKLNRFQKNLNHNSVVASAHHPKHHQGHQPQSGTSKSSSSPSISLEMSSIFEGVLDAFKLIRFQPSFKHSPIRACGDHQKSYQGHQPQSGTSKSINVIDL
jgi:hypothetical protein